MTTEITVKGEVEVLQYQPGDLVVCTVDRRLTPEEFEEIRRALAKRLPEGAQILVAERGVQFQIVREQRESGAAQ